ncbi:MAG TPA: 3-hydroxyacyl-CoA dehydrogenase NAD-binding domain-containing protein [Chitinophagaceae bacterium]|nr:3-hydroxyacyl-CoA dehydrogenase NAD-binding domain-containing protein [Chitinophagaceae bacterium]
MLEIQTICVCGAGTMGSGIAQVAAQSGFFTLLYDLDAAALQKASERIAQQLSLLVEKKKISGEEKTGILNRMRFTSDLQTCLADVFIEAIVEDPAVKVGLFNQLAEINHSESVFATNTSSLSVTQLARQVKNPGRFIGMHFFNPAPVMKLVEIVYTSFTDEKTKKMMVELAGQMGKTAVMCKDSPGFIVNRVARPYYIESLRLLEEKKLSIETIDRLLESGGFKLGPFKLMDLIGNDVNYAVSCSVYEQLQQPARLKPSYIQKEKVDKGEWGRKTNKGYYEYGH